MNEHKNEKKRNDAGLFIPNRQVSVVVAGAIVFAGAVFLGGYIVGKKHVMEQFVARIEQDSFADQVYSSLCDLYDHDMEETIVADREHECMEDVSLEDGEQPAKYESVMQISVAHEGEEISASEAQISTETIQEQTAEATSYRAQLLSYHVKKYADNFVEKLIKKGVPAEVKTRKSVTARGTPKLWYQVVTKPCADREALQVVVDRVSQEERIKGARIITC